MTSPSRPERNKISKLSPQTPPLGPCGYCNTPPPCRYHSCLKLPSSSHYIPGTELPLPNFNKLSVTQSTPQPTRQRLLLLRVLLASVVCLPDLHLNLHHITTSGPESLLTSSSSSWALIGWSWSPRAAFKRSPTTLYQRCNNPGHIVYKVSRARHIIDPHQVSELWAPEEKQTRCKTTPAELN